MNKLEPPAIQQPNAGGLIIEMPLEDVAGYLERVISLKVLASDEQLLDYLDIALSSCRSKPLELPPLERLEFDLKTSMMFQGKDPLT